MVFYQWFGLPRWLSGKESSYQCRRCRRHRFDLWIGKISWRRKWQLAPVFLVGASHGQRSLKAYSPCDLKKSDTTEYAHTSTKSLRKQEFYFE